MDLQSSTKFCHYTSLSSTREIISSEQFFLSKYNNMNDLVERDKHIDEKNKIFSLSLCNSEALNIPLFYLYGSIDGKGCRIQFTDAKLREVINSAEIYFVNKHNKLLRQKITSDKYQILYDWIYYISSNGYCEHHNDIPRQYDDFDTAYSELSLNNKHYFVKSPIWKYEKEFRIVIKFIEVMMHLILIITQLLKKVIKFIEAKLSLTDHQLIWVN